MVNTGFLTGTSAVSGLLVLIHDGLDGLSPPPGTGLLPGSGVFGGGGGGWFCPPAGTLDVGPGVGGSGGGV